MTELFKLGIEIYWDEIDQIYVAKIPKLGMGCMAHGKTVNDVLDEITIVGAMFLNESKSITKTMKDYNNIRAKLEKKL